jgi:FKBP-type peptidyl-prolyl cis-trans isomerase
MLNRIKLIALLTLHPSAVAPFSPAFACRTEIFDRTAATATPRASSTTNYAQRLPGRPSRGRTLYDVAGSGSDHETPQEGTESEPVSQIDRPPVPEGSHDELMYALGVNLARQLGDVRPLVESGSELACLAKGLLDTVVGRITEEGQAALLQRRRDELNELVQTRAYVPTFSCWRKLQATLRRIRNSPFTHVCRLSRRDSSTAAAARNAIRDRLEQAGRDMLEEMKKSSGAKALPSGVVLHVLDHGPEGPGRGKRATKASAVKIHYHGTLADGTTFDTTVGSDPVTIPLAAVIPGWREGVLNMHEGETAMLGIPPSQGYGDAGTPDGRIPGGSTLFFKIQLLEVLTASIGGGAELLGADGKKIDSRKAENKEGGLLGADGRPL